MEDVIALSGQCHGFGTDKKRTLTSMTREANNYMGAFSLRLAREGEWVRIVSVKKGKGFHDRLAGLGLQVGAEVQVLKNAMNGKILIGHEGTRLFLGGGMANKIQVAVSKGEDK